MTLGVTDTFLRIAAHCSIPSVYDPEFVIETGVINYLFEPEYIVSDVSSPSWL